jgi:cell division protein FtsA
MSIRGAHLNVKSIVASPIATGMACLSDEERELGVALIEMGAETTNVALFAGGMIAGLTTLPHGASDITDDIASAFGLRRAQAERIKCFYGSAETNPRDNHEPIEIESEGAKESAEPVRITRAQLVAVIRQRLDHTITEISKALKDLGFSGPAGRQIVLTGGGAELKSMADYMQGAMGVKVRIGRPAGLFAMPDAHSGPAFCTLAGLVLYAANEPADLRTMAAGFQTVKKYQKGSLVWRLVTAIRSAF